MRTFVVGMGKGGVGKSLLAFHLTHFAAQEAGLVLALDLDRQGSFQNALGVKPGRELPMLLDGYRKLADGGYVQAGEALYALPGSEDLVASQAGLLVRSRPATYLRDLLAPAPVEVVVLDTATEGYLSEMAQVAADVIVAPVGCSTADVDMLHPFLERAQELNDKAPILVVPNRYTRRNKVSVTSLAAIQHICGQYGIECTGPLPESVDLDSARLAHRPVWLARPNSAANASMHAVLRRALELAGVKEVACAL